MRPIIVSSGGAPCKVIRKYKNDIKRISNCILLDTSLADVKQLGPIEKKNPGYLIMNDGLNTTELRACTGIDIACSVTSTEGNEAQTKGRQGINRQKEDFVLAFAMDMRLGITEKIWKTIENQKLNLGTDYVLFMAGLGGGTGSGSINGIASRFYKGQESVPGSKHIVVGILPSIEENDLGENTNRLRFNTIWALYELMRPIKRPNPLILLDNEAMDSNDPRPTKPVMNLIHMMCEWRPDKDAGDFFTKYGRSESGCKTMAPYYSCIKKDRLRNIGPKDIDDALLNFKPDGKKRINPNENSPGRWLMTINEQDFILGRKKIEDGDPDTGGLYILTKGLTEDLRSYLKDKVCQSMEIHKESLQPNDIVVETPLLNQPGMVEFMILMLFDSPLELDRIRKLISTVDSLVNKENQFSLDNAFDHIPNKDAKKVLKNFAEAMIKDMAENFENPNGMPKHEIKFCEDVSRFELVDYQEED
jgi:hypothetical protein